MNKDAATVPTPQRAAEAVAENEGANRKIANAFLSIFGQPGKRGENQTLVLSHLEQQASDGRNCFQFHGKDGIAMALAAAHIDGAQAQIRTINRQISFATVLAKPKHAPKVRK